MLRCNPVDFHVGTNTLQILHKAFEISRLLMVLLRLQTKAMTAPCTLYLHISHCNHPILFNHT